MQRDQTPKDCASHESLEINQVHLVMTYVVLYVWAVGINVVFFLWLNPKFQMLPDLRPLDIDDAVFYLLVVVFNLLMPFWIGLHALGKIHAFILITLSVLPFAYLIEAWFGLIF